MMEQNVPFLDDATLQVLKDDFYNDGLLKHYKDLGPVNQVKDEIGALLESVGGVKKSNIRFAYKPLLLGADEEEDARLASENAKILHQSLGHISASQAAMEKVWVALLNTHYIDYHLHVIRQMQGRKEVNQQIWDRTFLTGPIHGEKRRQLMNNLSLLWWISHYTYDASDSINPYAMMEFFMSTPYRGNSIAFFSSNIHGNKKITLGILDGIKQLVENEVIAVNRYAYSNSSKIINMIAGVRLVDLMTREEIRDAIIEELPKMDNVALV